MKNVTIDFDERHWVTVLIGWNGTGKSNVLEALAIIFRDLIERSAPTFAYKLEYRIADHTINIDANPERAASPYSIFVRPGYSAPSPSSRPKAISFRKFVRRTELLPLYVFAYYSGENERLSAVFRDYKERYDRQLTAGDEPGLRRLFYARPYHSPFVLLSFMLQDDEVVSALLRDHLDLNTQEGIDSVLVVMREPERGASDGTGDPRFWGAKGIVAEFLAKLYDVSLAPLRMTRQERSLSGKRVRREVLYLFVKDMSALKQLLSGTTARRLFRDLESAYSAGLIEEVRIRVKLRSADGAVLFHELSEGEQQLLTVLGLLRLTAENESLFLLDEPDTHLNPRWSVDYLHLLGEIGDVTPGGDATNHVVLTTHNPLAIAELAKEQVQVLRRVDTQVVASHPELDPRGQGFTSIVTSDMFGIASSLDRCTQRLLEEQRFYAGKENLTRKELRRLDVINSELDQLGFRAAHVDDEFSRYLRLRTKLLQERFGIDSGSAAAEQGAGMTREERESLAEELVAQIIREDATTT
ncbi:MAG TPA: AAA family ATPase [Thermoanaerobaculia bacterium]|nr:AAA family ATPase [Thermoanaerobaculia bacterium]